MNQTVEQYARSWKPNTAKAYLCTWREWVCFLREALDRSPETATEDDALTYREALKTAPGQKRRIETGEDSDELQALGTIRRKAILLRKFYEIGLRRGIVKANPFREVVEMLRREKGTPEKRPTEMVEFERVMDVISAPSPLTPDGIRDRAFLACLFGGGLRKSEAIGLKLGDVRRTTKGAIYLLLRNTKSGEDAQQAIPAWAGEIVDKLYEHRKAQGAGRADPLFTNYRGNDRLPTNEHMDETTVYRRVKKYFRMCGLSETLTPHSARATAITKLLADGVPHREVQKFSRHASIAMVERYDKRYFGVDENPGQVLAYPRKAK